MEVIFELLLEVLVQILVAMGVEAVSKILPKPPSPWPDALVWVLVGLVLGAMSLGVVPSHMVKQVFWQLANLALTPVFVGLCVAAIARWAFPDNDQGWLRIGNFGHAYLFALAFALVRFTWAN